MSHADFIDRIRTRAKKEASEGDVDLARLLRHYDAMSDSKATTPAAPEGLERLSRQLKANARADIDGESLYLKAAVALDQAAALLQSRDATIERLRAELAEAKRERDNYRCDRDAVWNGARGFAQLALGLFERECKKDPNSYADAVADAKKYLENNAAKADGYASYWIREYENKLKAALAERQGG